MEENKTMKKVTSITLKKESEGLKTIYTYSEIDLAGNMIAQNERGNMILLADDDVAAFDKIYQDLEQELNK